MSTNLIKEFWNSRKNCPANRLHETHYGSYKELIQGKGYGTKKVTSPTDLHTMEVYDYPEDHFDYEITPVRCVEGVEFEPDDEGPVECITAAECNYHGNTVIVVLPVCSTASYIETYHDNGSYWDPPESEGYYEVSDDVEVGDDWSACFSSVEAYKNACKEWQKNRCSDSGKHISLGDYLMGHDDMHTVYTVDGDSFEDDTGGILSYLDESFYDSYLDVVCGNGFETEIGDGSVIDAYKAKLRNEEDKAEARWNKMHGYDF